MSRRGRIVLTLLATIPMACAPTLVAVHSYRGHGALDEKALATISELAEAGALNKAGVLSVLGPPVSVVGQGAGEIFVYRHVARDASEINLNPSYVVPSAPSLPLYVNNDVSGRDDVLMIFFGADGKVLGASMRQNVGDVTGSRAASQSDLVRGWVE
jgi:hypothetical protein